jgi:crotonobetainyl-CoA:carnitine CoA-transferase CaiB-like acyl-CoA transferase
VRTSRLFQVRGVPSLGEHTADVIRTLGLTDEQVQEILAPPKRKPKL